MRGFLSLRSVLAACAVAVGIGSVSHAQDHNIIMITHGAASDSFWAPVKKGAEDAAADVGVSLSYQAPEGGADMVAMTNLIRAAINQEPAGIIVTVPDVNALGGPISEASDAGIPVVTINSGTDTLDQTKAMFFVGEDLYEAGLISGKSLKALGGTKAACLNVQPGNVALDAICAGLNEGFGSDARVVPFGFDPSEVAAKTRALLESDPDLDALLSMSTTNAPSIANVIEEMGRLGEVHHSTFNLSTEVLEYIDQGKIAFTIDQQPYLQGYLPVIAIALKARYGITFYVDHIGSGPIVVDQSNAASVLDGVASGHR